MYNTNVNSQFRSLDFLIYMALALYLSSLFLPAIILVQAAPGTGLNILEIGWLGIFFGMFAWYANALVALAFIFAHIEDFKTALILLVGAILLGPQSFLLRLVPTSEANFGGCDLDPRLLGTTPCVPVDHLGVGFYLWMLSFMVLAAHCLVQLFRRRACKPK